MPEFQMYFHIACDSFLLCLFADNGTSDDFLPSFTFLCQLNKKVNLMNRYSFPVVATNALPFQGFSILHLFFQKLGLLYHTQISVSSVPMAVTMARYIRAACLSDYYINRALKLNTSPPSPPPGTYIIGPNSVADPPSLLSPHP
ncbi:hypothetical protein T05_11175 [Trichinella murrelli]|uniref:Uncharacterized protein n=1 Tax=Trichinella murrelli TaxID=144512 RepID=A0A0V0T534_9BILA|nr:hypothetical protein T05_14783 [Trichinella murrelli]KRX34153.1 hypothetical protein T05_11175 [Trichinella murrelli]